MTRFADRSALVRTVAGLLFPFAALSPCFAGQDSAIAPLATGPRPVVVLDPAHGGLDAGAHLSGNLLEKDVTLALAVRTRAALSAAGFSVISTRDSDLGGLLSADQRAEIANRPHVLACLVLHATATGSGVHVYISKLKERPASPPSSEDQRQAFVPVPWDSAQASVVNQSSALSKDVANAISAAQIPVLIGEASVRPLDNLLCPAVVVEIAPLSSSDSVQTAVSDSNYQQHLAAAIASALKAWRKQFESAAGASTAELGGADR